MVFTIAAQYTLGSSENGTNDKYVVQNKKTLGHFTVMSVPHNSKKKQKNVVYIRNL